MIKNTKFKILTPEGFKDFKGINKVEGHTEVIRVDLANGDHLIGSPKHPIMREDNEWVRLGEVSLGQMIKVQNDKISNIIGIEVINDYTDPLYDIIEVSDNNSFYANSILTHNCDFTTSGDSVISNTKLDEMTEKFVKEPIAKKGADEELWIWKEVVEGANYMIAADVARGDGTDYSTFHIFNITTLEQVAEFKHKIDATTFGQVLVTMAKEYNNALLVVENTGVGWATIQSIIDTQYDNIFYSYKSDDPYIDVNVLRSKKRYDMIDKTKMVPGFSMSAKVRPHIIEKMESFIREDEIFIRSQRTINELRTFIWMNGKAQAMRGYNDDLVMPMATAIWIRETALRMKGMGKDMTKGMMSGVTTNIPQDENSDRNNPYLMGQSPNGDKEDMDVSWLFSKKDKQADNIHKQHRPPTRSITINSGIYLG